MISLFSTLCERIIYHGKLYTAEQIGNSLYNKGQGGAHRGVKGSYWREGEGLQGRKGFIAMEQRRGQVTHSQTNLEHKVLRVPRKKKCSYRSMQV